MSRLPCQIFCVNFLNHISRLVHPNSAWWSQMCWASSLSGAVVEPVPQPSPLSPPLPRCLNLLALPVQCCSRPGIYPQDTPRCRFWRSPQLASLWTRAAPSRSGRCSARQGGAWASRSGSGCCSRRSSGCSPAQVSVRSTGPPRRRTGSIGGCCWTNQAPAGTANLQKQLQKKYSVIYHFNIINDSFTSHGKYFMSLVWVLNWVSNPFPWVPLSRMF